MRFGKWRGVPFTFALATLLAMGSMTVRADGWRLHPTMPGEVPAYDYSTGGEFMAPPVPYGHYAKDPGAHVAKGLGLIHGTLGTLCSKCGSFLHFGGLGHKCGDGNGCGHGHGNGCGLGNGGCGLGKGCGSGLGDKCGFCSGLGLFNHGKCGAGACGGAVIASAQSAGCGLAPTKHFAPCHASTVVPTSQTVVAASGQAPCGLQGCGMSGLHSHLDNLKNKLRCHFCKGSGCGGCGGKGIGDPCGGCGGLGMLSGHGCNTCGGCGLGGGCGLCGGKGCANCLKGMGHGLLGHLKGSALGLFHQQKVDWFVGAGGPVPLTPGYVPYIVTTRSPRDFFSFPPMNPNDP